MKPPKQQGRGVFVPRVVSIGTQDFEKLIVHDCFYIDKTLFIKEWWKAGMR